MAQINYPTLTRPSSKDHDLESLNMDKIRDLVLEDPVARHKWAMVVDNLILSVVDTHRIKHLLKSSPAEAVLQSLLIWKAYGHTSADLLRVLRRYNLSTLADEISSALLHYNGSAIPIVELGSGKTVRINLQVLNNILDLVGNRKLAIYSINGKTRSGKSFMLCQFMKYLKFGNTHPNDWISQKLSEEFSWHSGMARVTSGLQLWSEIFLVQDGECETAVLLMDVQGFWDFQTETRGDAILFAFSTLLSSVNIFNVNNASADTFQFLHAFLECAKLSIPIGTDTEREGAAFQKLVLLLRDFVSDREYGFGLHDDRGCPENEEGLHANLKNYYFDYLDPSILSSEAIRDRQAISSCYRDLSVVALPHPGLRLVKDDSDPLNWEPRFKAHVVEFVESILGTASVYENVKRVGNEEITGYKLKDFVQAWADLYTNSDQIPEIKSIIQATNEIQGRQTVAKYLSIYRNGIEQVIRENPDGSIPYSLTSKHETLKASCLQTFQATRLVGGEFYQKPFIELLTKEIDHAYEYFLELNQKNLATAARAAEGDARREAAKQLSIETAQLSLDEARRALDAARTRLTALHQNRESFYNVTYIRTKHATRVFGFKGSPYYTTEAAKVFDHARFDQAVAMAKEDVQGGESRVQQAINAWEVARNQ